MPSSYPYPPCPLCGGDADCESCSPEEWMVQCQGCYVQGPVCETLEEAEAGWERLTSMVRLPPGVVTIQGEGWVMLTGWEWEVHNSSGWVGSPLRPLTLQEACDQVCAELAKLEEQDDE